MDRSSTTQDVFQVLVSLLISALLLGSVSTQDVLPRDNMTIGTHDGLASGNITLSSMTTVDPASCDHMDPCQTGIVCGCYYYKRKDRLGRTRDGCRKMIDCSQKNLTVNSLMKIDFSQFDETDLDIKMEGNKLQVKDIDSLGQHIYNNTKTETTILYFGPLLHLPCPTQINIIRKWGMNESTTQVFCNNRNLTDRHIEDIVFPSLTKRLNLQNNTLTLRARLEGKMQSLQHLEYVDLDYNKLTAIPRLNISQKINNNFFVLTVRNNDIRTCDTAQLEQYADINDDIYIRIENNPFVRNCEAYFTNADLDATKNLEVTDGLDVAIPENVFIEPQIITTETTEQPGCGAEYSTSTGVISHPLGGRGRDYTNNEDCAWIIRATVPFKITFIRFDTEENYDFLKIKDDDEGNASLSGRRLPRPLQINSGTAYLTFTSDSSRPRNGFELRWEASEIECREGVSISGRCFRILTDRRRTFEQAQSRCKIYGSLAHHVNNIALDLRKQLLNKYGGTIFMAWLDGRGDGSSMRVHSDGSVIQPNSSLWLPGFPGHVDRWRCLGLLTNHYWLTYRPTAPYATASCTSRLFALCESTTTTTTQQQQQQ